MDPPLIAKKSFRVYKYLKSNNESPFQDFKYHKGYRYEDDFRFYLGFSLLEITQGLHSFESIKAAHKYRENSTTIGRNHKLRIMWIPRGAKYFKNDNGEICSNKLTWY